MYQYLNIPVSEVYKRERSSSKDFSEIAEMPCVDELAVSSSLTATTPTQNDKKQQIYSMAFLSVLDNYVLMKFFEIRRGTIPAHGRACRCPCIQRPKLPDLRATAGALR